MGTTFNTPKTTGAVAPTAASEAAAASAGPQPGTRHRWRLNYRSFAGIACILLVWQLISTLGLFSAAVLPAPTQVIAAWWHWMFGSGGGLYDGTWLQSALTSAGRVLQGFVIASLLGVVLGIMIGYFRTVYTVLDPVVQLFRPIPAVAWVPLAAVFFGFTHNATIFLISYGAFFPIVLNSAAGVLRSQKTYIQVGQMMGANRYEMLRYIVLPAAMPSVFTGLRLGIGTAWILVIVGEMIAVRTGLGYSLLNAYTVFRYDIVIAAMASFGILGLLSDRLVLQLEARVLKWREGYDVAST